MTLAYQNMDYMRGYNAGLQRGRRKGREDAVGAFELIMRLGAEIEASSQEKIVGLTNCERAVVEFYRAALKESHK